MSTATSFTGGPDSVAQFAALVQKFARMQPLINDPAWEADDPEDRADARTLLIASGLFAIADQLQRIGDALTAPLPDAPLEIPVGGDDTLITE